MSNLSIDLLVDVEECVKSAAHTQGKESLRMTPEKWLDWLHSEHSQIRIMQLRINMNDIPYYCAMHLVRHTQGIQPFVRSQRPTALNAVDYDRRKAPQDSLVDYRPVLNPQSLINISRKRMCRKADDVTRKIWIDVRNAIENYPDPYVAMIAKVMMPDCMYRGGICHELSPCGFSTPWREELEIENALS